MVRSTRGVGTGGAECPWVGGVISGEHDCLRGGGRTLIEKDGEEVVETLEGSRVE